MSERRQWTLGAKLAVVAAPIVLLSLIAIGMTLQVSWQLEGGAAAVNEAGRMRMQIYRLSLSIATADVLAVPAQVAAFDRSLELLRTGDVERPLMLPRDPQVVEQLSAVERQWAMLRDQWTANPRLPDMQLRAQAAVFVASIDTLVDSVEAHISRWMAIQHLLQTAVLLLAVAGCAILMLTGYRFVLEPVQQLKRAIQRLQGGDFTARVANTSNDEFGTLASGFNELAAHLQSMYRNLEAKVAEKTCELDQRRERLEALYDMTTLITRATTLDELASGFSQRIVKVARADAVALRWSDERNGRYLVLADHGLPRAMREAEQCLVAGDCFCGAPTAPDGMRVIPVKALPAPSLKHCAQAAFKTVLSIPIRLHERTLGEVNLFHHAAMQPSEAEQSLLEALTGHLATAMENLRLDGLAKEAAISQERNLLARELHDSIAQSLAFLKIQVQLMRDALASSDAKRVQSVLDEIDVGVRESYADVRELLVHFRTRPTSEDIEPALQSTLRKFERQSGLATTLAMRAQGMPLAPDVQVQVLHIVQEALSNVRRHARASRVWIDVAQESGGWRFEVRDDGAGFATDDHARDEAHIGLRIMTERAERLGAHLEVHSAQEEGTSVVLLLPAGNPERVPAVDPPSRHALQPGVATP